MAAFYFRWGALLASLAAILGAFATHSLAERIDARALQSFEAGVRYQFFHAIGLMLIALNVHRFSTLVKWPLRLFVIGTLLFSLSIYVLAIRSIAGWEGIEHSIWWITPLGGLCLIIAWALLIPAFRKS